jgi:transposase
MTKNIKFVGLDVHAATVVIAVAEEGGEVRSLGTVANEIGAIRRVLGSLIPKVAGDRVKRDRRDALKLDRSHRAGDLTAV